MLRPEIIEKIRKKNEDVQQPLELPLYPPQPFQPHPKPCQESEEVNARVVVIEL
ncbi:MAG: hypothetical protein HY540_00775 [Deltaproteobacteria bacterium]|nr:hypothetical protein [Deltaproteobacteria bacterium]